VLRLLIAVLVLAAGGGIAVAESLPSGQDKAAALQRHASVATTDSNTEPAIPPATAPHPIPARMLGSGTPVPIPPSLLRVRNGWLVSDGRTLVAVYAGAAGKNPSVGRLVIVRQNLRAGRQTVRTLDAGPTGALTVAAAPLGRAVETSAQTGALRLRAPRGQVFRLDLRTRTLTRSS
jgi:hypothetical protein